MYLPLFLRQLGLSPSESSVIIGTMPFLSGFIRPLAGSLADKLRRHKEILALFSLLSGVIISLMLLVPAQQIPSSLTLDIRGECDEGIVHISVCPGDQCTDFNATIPVQQRCTLWCIMEQSDETSLPSSEINNSAVHFSLPLDFTNYTSACITGPVSDYNYSEYPICNSIPVPICKLNCEGNITEAGNCAGRPPPKFGVVFWVLWMLNFLGGIFYYPTFGLLDACTNQLLKKDITNYGIQRAYGTLGFAIFGFGAGYLMQVQTRDGGHANFTIPFMCFFICHMVLAIVVMTFKATRDVKCDSIFINAIHLLKDIKVFSIAVILFIFGAFVGIIEAILFWHLKTLGAPDILFGVSIVVQASVEFIMLFASGPVIIRIGNVNCIYIAGIAYIIRFVLCAMIRNPWLVLLPDLLNGLTFGLFFASVTVYVANVTPLGMKATMHNLVSSIHFSFGE